jgi:prepilin-type N-terminal cleavage/methylation domain-containing protein
MTHTQTHTEHTMKLTQSHTTTRKSGMTLLELTVVILVLLSLISILFIGARAWKKGSDRAGCIMNIRNVQQAVRSHANMRGLSEGAAFTESDVFGPGKYMEKTIAELACPQEGPGAYTAAAAGEVPEVGILYVECDVAETDDHVPSEHGDW